MPKTLLRNTNCFHEHHYSGAIHVLDFTLQLRRSVAVMLILTLESQLGLFVSDLYYDNRSHSNEPGWSWNGAKYPSFYLFIECSITPAPRVVCSSKVPLCTIAFWSRYISLCNFSALITVMLALSTPFLHKCVCHASPYPRQTFSLRSHVIRKSFVSTCDPTMMSSDPPINFLP